MDKKELVIKYIVVSNTTKVLEDFVGQIFDQICSDESDFSSKDQYEKTKAAVEKAKKQFADAVPNLIEEIYYPSIEAAFTEDELKELIEYTSSDLYKKLQEFNKEFNDKIQVKTKPLFDKIMEDCFKDIF